MPKAWSKKDERQYEHVKESAKERGGRSAKRAEEIAARTVNKQRKREGRTKEQREQGKSSSSSSRYRSSARTKRAGGLEERTVDELKQRAKQLGVSGYSKMRKQELVKAVRSAS